MCICWQQLQRGESGNIITNLQRNDCFSSFCIEFTQLILVLVLRFFWDGGLVLPSNNCALKRIQEAAKRSKAVLHFWWKRCQLNKTERPQLCMISITLLAETTHLTWPENFSIYLSQKNWAFLVFQGINQDVVPAVCNVAFRSKKAQTDIWLKRTCSFQCMLPAHTTLYTLSYIVLHCTYSVCHTQTDIWLYESFPVCDSEKNGDRGKEKSSFQSWYKALAGDKQKFIEYRISQGFC